MLADAPTPFRILYVPSTIIITMGTTVNIGQNIVITGDHS